MKIKQIALAVASLGCIMTAFPGAVQAGELDEMKAMLQKLQARIDTLEAQKAAAPAANTGATTAVTAGNPSPFANSSVTLYGKLDVFTEYDTGGGKGSRFAIDSGGMNGSRWGVKGGTDITSDIRGIFQVEGGFYANKGASSQSGLLFGRQAYAGAQGKFGTITVGRQYSPYYNTVIGYDPFEQGYGSPTNSGQVSAGTTRYDNSLIYASPKFGGLNVVAMGATKGDGGETGGNKHGAAALAFNYGTGPFAATLATQKDDHINNATAVTRYAYAAASYDFGRVKLMGGTGRVNRTFDAASDTTRREWMIGAKTKMTSSGTLLTVLGRGRTTGLDDSSTAIAVGWIEALNPQTNVYGVLSHHTNGKASANTPMGTMSSGSYSINNGQDPTGLALGFQYSF
jgi:predicted porin